jgi:crotonobetainyl-CoA hydratase
MSDYEYMIVERDGPITTLTLNRPEVMNALHYPAHVEAEAIVDAFAADPGQWVLIVTGAGDRAFSAGNDLKYQAAGNEMKAPPGGFAGLSSREGLMKPVIAAVNGVAMGGGFETALACDIIVASERASFALPEPRVGLVALGGGVQRLPRAIGLARAMDVILTSRRIDAAEGKALGFVSRVVPPGQLMEAAKAIASEICLASPMAVRAAKEATLRSFDEPIFASMRDQWDYPAMKALFGSEDVVEGPRAFAEKRPPRWTGG